jgi:steroid delta-isomerase-like uncharacterized protein
MSIADLKARTQQIFDMFNTHDPDAAAAHFAEVAELRDSAGERPIVGRQAIAAVYVRHFAAFPDSCVRVDRMLAESDTVAVEWTLTATHQGKILGFPATGKTICVKGISIIRYRGNMAVSDTRMWDLAAMLRQIGLLPGQE